MRAKLTTATVWLRVFLAGGPRRATEVFHVARAEGIAYSTLLRAKLCAGVKSSRCNTVCGYWTWALGVESAALGDDHDRALDDDHHDRALDDDHHDRALGVAEEMLALTATRRREDRTWIGTVLAAPEPRPALDDDDVASAAPGLLRRLLRRVRSPQQRAVLKFLAADMKPNAIARRLRTTPNAVSQAKHRLNCTFAPLWSRHRAVRGGPWSGRLGGQMRGASSA